jgi:hypothetical protein
LNLVRCLGTYFWTWLFAVCKSSRPYVSIMDLRDCDFRIRGGVVRR